MSTPGAGHRPRRAESSARERLAARPERRHAGRSVLEADPALGAWLSADRRSEAITALSATPLARAMGEWDVTPMLQAGPAHVGLLIVEGFLAREVQIQDQVSTELLGPGDLFRPWDDCERDHDAALFRIRWNVLTPSRLLLLDRRFAARLREYPEVTAALFERMHQRSQRLAATKAIAQLVNVERRLIAVFWHLAEHWGFVTAEGVAIPLTVSHRLLGEIVGARRPTVSIAIKALRSRDELTRRPDGTWLLPTHEAPEFNTRAQRVVPARRRLFSGDPAPQGTGREPVAMAARMV